MIPLLKKSYILFIFALCLLFFKESFSFEYDFSGKLSLWSDYSYSEDDNPSGIGLRYIPFLNIEEVINEESSIDFEVLLNIYSTGSFEETSGNSQTDSREKDSNVKLYRAKLRYVSPRSEIRAGLQKLNFGPARLLRTLKWFDSIDPADPLKFTDGVYGLRFKYDALDNSSYWLYALYGNDDPKGYEIYPTVSNRPEFGGRIQYPLFNGEIATTFHTRTAGDSTLYTENRIAFDGQWDACAGLWFESMFQHSDSELFPEKYLTMITFGADYTFGIGNGVHVLLENMTIDTSDDLFNIDNSVNITALSVDYPLGMIDSLTIMGYYLWDTQTYLSYFIWNRIYDTIIVNVTMFNHATDSVVTDSSIQFGSQGGYGGQLTFIYNH